MSIASRPLTDNRMLRATAGPDLTVGFGSAAGAMFSTPQWQGLSLQSGELQKAAEGAFTVQQSDKLAQQEADYNAQARDLEKEITLTPPGDERDQLISTLSGLQEQHDVAVSAITQESIDAGRMKTPDDLNAEYSDLGLVFDRPMSSGEAEVLAKNKLAEITRQAIIEAGPNGAMATVGLFGAGLLSVAVDPFEVASMFIPVVGPAARMRLTAKFGRVGEGVIVGATEGLVGSALTEPFYYKLSKSQQLDYTMSDALLNIGVGAVFGGGIGAVAGRIAKAADEKGVTVRPSDVAPEPAKIEPTRIEPERAAPPEKVQADTVRPMMREDAAQVMLAKFVNDQPLDVSILGARPPKRPQTLLEFIRQSGGINDNVTTFKGELKNMGINPSPRNNGVNNPTSKLDLDDIAGLAAEAGFIEERDVAKLLDSIRKEVGGEPAFSRADTSEAQAWKDFHEARTAVEAYQSELDGIRKDIESLGVKNVTDSEIAAVSEMMATKGIELDDAWEQVATRNVQELRAKQLAKDAEVNPLADMEAAQAYNDFVGSDFAAEELGYDLRNYGDAVSQIEDTLTPDQKAMLDEVARMEEKATAYADVAKVAANCMART